MKAAPIESRSLLAFGRWLVMLVFVTGVLSGTALAQQTQAETSRKAVQKVVPHYPEIAKGMRLSGTVRVAVEVAPNGKVVFAEVLGGHPLLAEVAADAARQFRFEAAAKRTEEVVIFNFQP
jgi:TonB family protein